MKQTVLFVIGFLIAASVLSQTKPLTTAEKTDYEATSNYSEVISFINNLDKQSNILRIEQIAKTGEGRSIPMMVIANPMIDNWKDTKNDKRIVVYIQANIHAGEVEGKEATQMLARDLIADPKSEILKNCIVLIDPIFNADGNEKFSTKNRTNQNGPASVGVRYNGQQLDLNRDAMKLESPEVSGLVENVLNKWDPAIFVDCHTTNGSYHEEPVTFTWMMNPNGDRDLINYMRDEMMPSVHKNLRDKHKVENVFYGEFVDRMNLEMGWISYASEPRYIVNYVGIRNRLSILNENYVYADFKTRVLGSNKLLWSILEYASAHGKEIKTLLAKADKKTVERGLNPTVTDSFAIEYKGYPTPEKITIKAFEADTIPGVKGYWRYKQSDRKRTITVDYIADYYPTKSVKFPYAYIITKPDAKVLENLNKHGIEVDKLDTNRKLMVERFNIKKLKPSQRINQGHYTNNTIKGSFTQVEKEFPKGTVIVRTAQPLGWLVASLLEPQAGDGLLKWNFFDKYLSPQWGSGFYPYPVYIIQEKTEL